MGRKRRRTPMETTREGRHQRGAPRLKGSTREGKPPARGASGEGCQQGGAPAVKGAQADYEGGKPQGRGTTWEGQRQGGAPRAKGASRERHYQRGAHTGRGTSGAGHKHGWVAAERAPSGEGVGREERQRGGSWKGGLSTERGDRRRRGGKKEGARARKGTSRTQHRGEGTPAGTNMGAVGRRRGQPPPGTQKSGHVDPPGLTQPLASAGTSFPEFSIRADRAHVSSGLQSVNIDTTNGRPRSQCGGDFVHRRARGVRHH